MIKFQNISKIYPSCSDKGEITTLTNISFEIKKGEFCSIVGRSGAGKTTLLKLLLAEEKPTEGHIFFEDQDIGKLRPGDLPYLRKRIGAVFQDYKLLPFKNAYENVSYTLEVIGATDREIKRDVPKVLEIVGLKERAFNFPEELSGGEKQRVAIARSMIHRPDIIIADEPTGNLDLYNAADIIQLLIKINEMGTTIILATHDKPIIDALGKRVITLDQGRIIKDEERGRFLI
ncbi:cell division ATP-binding protein FtsE [Patescibacteria group bacterium]